MTKVHINYTKEELLDSPEHLHSFNSYSFLKFSKQKSLARVVSSSSPPPPLVFSAKKANKNKRAKL